MFQLIVFFYSEKLNADKKFVDGSSISIIFLCLPLDIICIDNISSI